MIMDGPTALLRYNPQYRSWICTSCRQVVILANVVGHLATKHRRHPLARSGAQRAAIYVEAAKVQPWDPVLEPFIPPPPDAPPIPGLTVHDGYGCPENGCPESGCPFAARTPKSLQNHRRRQHPSAATRRRGKPRADDRDRRELELWPVKCQRLYPNGLYSSFFVVTPTADKQRIQRSLAVSEADFVQAQVGLALLRSDGITEAEDGIAPCENDVTEVSPWLELTRWPEYIRGHRFEDVASLARLPDPVTEPLLAAVEQSVERLTRRAFDSISSHRINEFDQVRINSFARNRPGVWERPIQIKLRGSTYSRYRQSWVRLLSFVYRTSRPHRPHRPQIQLRHRFTTPQLAAIDELHRYAEQLLHTTAQAHVDSTQPSAGARATGRLDQACLDLSIALLDHEIRGDLFESPVVGFLAALGVDARNQTYHEPASYTGHLSALVKIAQMLVSQRAIDLADQGQVQHPGDALDEMRERFLLYGTRAPFSWIVRLRTYGKKIQNTSTSLGFLVWSDDH